MRVLVPVCTVILLGMFWCGCDSYVNSRIESAAESGDGEAQAVLGTMYALGKGVEKSEVEAFRWYQRSAAQGNANGQLFLGASYRLGEGVEPDAIESYVWFSLAASDMDAAALMRDRIEKDLSEAELAEAQRRLSEFKPKAWEEVKALYP